MNSRESILVTGGAGFLGAHLVRALLQDHRCQDFPVVVLDDLSGGFRENLPISGRVEFREGSVTDHRLVEDLFRTYSFRFVFHLAAYAAEGLSHFIRRFNYTNNLLGSINLINSAVLHRTQHFVFTSSIAVYGSAQVPMRESTVPQPEDPYGIAKLAVESDLRAAHEQFGLNYTIFRPHNVYGEFQNLGDRYRNVVGIFMNRILQGQPLPVFGDGLQQRAFSYVGDLMQPLISAPFVTASHNQIFNVGASEPASILQLAEVIGEEFGVNPRLEFLPARNEVKLAWADHTRSDEVFGLAAPTSLRQGVHLMAEWARSVGARTSRFFGEIEIPRGLPPSWQNEGPSRSETMES